MGELLRRIRYLMNRRRLDAELADEMEFHREMAEKAGRKNFGSMALSREQAREAWGWAWLDNFVQDLRFGMRIWVRTPGLTFVAILVLALGVGVNVAAFSFFDQVALRPLPVPDAERIVRLERRSPDKYTSEMAYPSFLFYREHAKTLSATMAVLGVPPLQMDEDKQQTSASFVTANYFTELGARAMYGRLFEPGVDDDANAPAAVVISYGLWQRRFGGNASVIGQIVRLNRKPATVVGVLAETFASLGGQRPDLWMPTAQQPYFIEGSKALQDWGDSSVRMWGKLAVGINAGAAGQELRMLTDELRRQHPDAVWEGEFIQVSPGGHLQVMQAEMYRVAGMVGVLTLLILVVCCTNLGGLLMARSVTREREIGIRMSIGAVRTRILRQLCTESLLLAGAGSLAGLALAYATIRILLAKMDAPRWLSATPDWRVLGFTVAMTAGAALLFGLAPALQIAREKHRKALARQILVGIQITGSTVLVILAALLLRATQHALSSDPGFAYEQLVSIDPQLGRHNYKAEAARSYLEEMENRIRGLAGVTSVSLVELPPLGHVVSREDLEIDGRPVRLYPNWVTPDFFETMRIPLKMGRTFYPGEKGAVIVSESFARIQWPGQNPLGQRIGEEAKRATVVGVAGDARINALSDDDATEQYWPAGGDEMPNMVLIVRSTGEPEQLAAAARTISESMDASIFPEIRQIKLLYRENVEQIELAASGVSAVGMAAVGLSCVGIIGLVAFTVTQRTKEMAIRIAVGEPGIVVLGTVLRQFIVPMAIGLIAGTSLAIAGSKLLRVVLYGINNLDMASYAGAIFILTALMALSMILPAVRLLKLNLAATLRYD